MKRILFAALTAAALFSDGILQSLNAQNMEIPKKVSPFPVGDKLPEQFSKYFVGQAWLAPLTDDKRLNAPVSNVTFSPGCRNNWHSHTGGQLLIAVGGRGYYQEKGRPARALLPGDIVEIAPDVVHWHGAAPDSWFSHLAVACNPATNENAWLEPDRQPHSGGFQLFQQLRPPAWVKTPDAAWPNCFRAEYRNLGMRTPNYLKFLVTLRSAK